MTQPNPFCKPLCEPRATGSTTKHHGGSMVIQVGGVLYDAHRLVWLYATRSLDTPASDWQSRQLDNERETQP